MDSRWNQVKYTGTNQITGMNDYINSIVGILLEFFVTMQVLLTLNHFCTVI